MTDNIFAHADRSLMVIYNNMGREFQSVGTTLGFDELNILGVHERVNAMYQRMNDVVVREFRKIARKAYKDAEMSLYKADIQPSKDDFDYDNFVYAMLRAYDPLSGYVYTREWTRKRDRLFESIIATNAPLQRADERTAANPASASYTAMGGNQEIRRNLKRGLDVLANQVRQYADNVTIKARIKAFKKAGVKYVRWVTENDEKVCKVCAPRDGMIYMIDEVPMIPAHYHCRCQLYPATETEYNAQRVDRLEE